MSEKDSLGAHEGEGGATLEGDKIGKKTQEKGNQSGIKSKISQATRKISSLSRTAKKVWLKWVRFQERESSSTLPQQNQRQTTSRVDGFEEIACIEADLPDFMLGDTDKVRTTCKECIENPPAFPTKDEVKSKLISADKYYGVTAKLKERQKYEKDASEHEADYFDDDGSLIRPSWRFILERPLVEQYVLMTSYIRKISVLSELNEEVEGRHVEEEEDEVNDVEYRRFTNKYKRETQRLLMSLKKPPIKETAVQTTIKLTDDVRGVTSEVSLYPDSGEWEPTLRLKEPSAVTIVTSRDFSPSDIDSVVAPNNDPKPPSSSVSSDKKTTSGSASDGFSVPIHSTEGTTSLGKTTPSVPIKTQNLEAQLKKKVSFSSKVHYYQTPTKGKGLYNLPLLEEPTCDNVNQQSHNTVDEGPNQTPPQDINKKPQAMQSQKPSASPHEEQIIANLEQTLSVLDELTKKPRKKSESEESSSTSKDILKVKESPGVFFRRAEVPVEITRYNTDTFYPDISDEDFTRRVDLQTPPIVASYDKEPEHAASPLNSITVLKQNETLCFGGNSNYVEATHKKARIVDKRRERRGTSVDHNVYQKTSDTRIDSVAFQKPHGQLLLLDPTQKITIAQPRGHPVKSNNRQSSSHKPLEQIQPGGKNYSTLQFHEPPAQRLDEWPTGNELETTKRPTAQRFSTLKRSFQSTVESPTTARKLTVDNEQTMSVEELKNMFERKLGLLEDPTNVSTLERCQHICNATANPSSQTQNSHRFALSVVVISNTTSKDCPQQKNQLTETPEDSLNQSPPHEVEMPGCSRNIEDIKTNRPRSSLVIENEGMARGSNILVDTSNQPEMHYLDQLHQSNATLIAGANHSKSYQRPNAHVIQMLSYISENEDQSQFFDIAAPANVQSHPANISSVSHSNDSKFISQNNSQNVGSILVEPSSSNASERAIGVLQNEQDCKTNVSVVEDCQIHNNCQNMAEGETILTHELITHKRTTPVTSSALELADEFQCKGKVYTTNSKEQKRQYVSDSQNTQTQQCTSEITVLISDASKAQASQDRRSLSTEYEPPLCTSPFVVVDELDEVLGSQPETSLREHDVISTSRLQGYVPAENEAIIARRFANTHQTSEAQQTGMLQELASGKVDGSSSMSEAKQDVVNEILSHHWSDRNLTMDTPPAFTTDCSNESEKWGILHRSGENVSPGTLETEAAYSSKVEIVERNARGMASDRSESLHNGGNNRTWAQEGALSRMYTLDDQTYSQEVALHPAKSLNCVIQRQSSVQAASSRPESLKKEVYNLGCALDHEVDYRISIREATLNCQNYSANHQTHLHGVTPNHINEAADSLICAQDVTPGHVNNAIDHQICAQSVPSHALDSDVIKHHTIAQDEAPDRLNNAIEEQALDHLNNAVDHQTRAPYAGPDQLKGTADNLTCVQNVISDHLNGDMDEQTFAQHVTPNHVVDLQASARNVASRGLDNRVSEQHDCASEAAPDHLNNAINKQTDSQNEAPDHLNNPVDNPISVEGLTSDRPEISHDAVDVIVESRTHSFISIYTTSEDHCAQTNRITSAFSSSTRSQRSAGDQRVILYSRQPKAPLGKAIYFQLKTDRTGELSTHKDKFSTVSNRMEESVQWLLDVVPVVPKAQAPMKVPRKCEQRAGTLDITPGFQTAPLLRLPQGKVLFQLKRRQ